jgi:hypothetical protein
MAQVCSRKSYLGESFSTDVYHTLMQILAQRLTQPPAPMEPWTSPSLCGDAAPGRGSYTRHTFKQRRRNLPCGDDCTAKHVAPPAKDSVVMPVHALERFGSSGAANTEVGRGNHNLTRHVFQQRRRGEAVNPLPDRQRRRNLACGDDCTPKPMAPLAKDSVAITPAHALTRSDNLNAANAEVGRGNHSRQVSRQRRRGLAVGLPQAVGVVGRRLAAEDRGERGGAGPADRKQRNAGGADRRQPRAAAADRGQRRAGSAAVCTKPGEQEGPSVGPSSGTYFERRAKWFAQQERELPPLAPLPVVPPAQRHREAMAGLQDGRA